MSLMDYASAVRVDWWRRTWVWLASAGVLAGAIFTIGGRRWMAPSAAAEVGVYVTVLPGPMSIVFHQEGQLEALHNIDITCPVEGQNTIQSIVPEGTYVKAGQTIAVLDSAELQRKVETDDLELEKAEGDVRWSREQKGIEEAKNKADLDAAISARGLAEIDLNEYTKGEYPATLQEDQRKLDMTNLSLKKKLEELATSRRLQQGGYISRSEVEKAELDVVTAQNEQEKAASDLQVLKEFKNAKDLAEKQDKLTQAENKIATVKEQNASNLNQKIGDLNTKERQLVLRRAASEHSHKMFEGCTIKAPTDGMVLYASSVQQYMVREQPIQAGSKVMQEEMIVRLPDVSKMKAVVKIPEGRVSKLKLDPANPIRATVAIVGVADPINATMTSIGVLPDNTQRWWNPDSKDYPVDLTLDQTPPGLKPGASAKCDLMIETLQNVLAAPVGALYSVGDQHYVFLKNDTGKPKACEVTIGKANETLVEITKGLPAGADVLLLQPGQGQSLLDQTPHATTTPASHAA